MDLKNHTALLQYFVYCGDMLKRDSSRSSSQRASKLSSVVDQVKLVLMGDSANCLNILKGSTTVKTYMEGQFFQIC